MTTLALEIHDAGLLTVSENGDHGDERPGYALYDGGALTTGRPALERAREKPRWIHHRFWQDLDTRPLGKPFPSGLSAADLAHVQLSEAWQAMETGVDSVLLAVPGCFTAPQLGLVLGIARSCAMPVTGMVDTAVAASTVAAAAVAGRGNKLLHLDLHLHRVVLTEMELTLAPAAAGPANARLVRRGGEVGEGLGQIALQDAWARRIAELFVQATRFDPLHSAATEQLLYSHLPHWLTRLRSEQIVEVELESATGVRTFELTRPDIVAAVDVFYEQFLALALSHKRAGEPVTLLLSHRVAQLPGLERRLAGLRDVTTLALPAGSAATGALATREEILSAGGHNTDRPQDQPSSESLPFVTRLSFAPAAASVGLRPSATPAVPTTRPPSHVLHEGLAYPIRDDVFWLGSALGDKPGLALTGAPDGISRTHCAIRRDGGRIEIEDHSTQGCTLNGERVAGKARLVAGDRLRLGASNIEVRLIAVVDDDGAP